MYGVSLEKVKKYIKEMYLKGNRRSIILLGQPGIGKSETVRQLAQDLAQELNKEFIEIVDNDEAIKVLKEPEKYFVLIDIRLTQIEPVDLTGIPKDLDGEVTYKPFLWMKVLSKTAGILFLDEITNVQRPDMIAAMYQILLERKTNAIKFNDNVLVIAAGNTPEMSSIANALPAPLLNRVRVFYIRAPSIDEWKEYMNAQYGESWDKRVYSFLKRRPELFIKISENETLEPYPTPRSWTMLAEVSKYFNCEDLKDIAIATVGVQAGSEFAIFASMKVPSIEELIKNPEIFDKLEIDQKYLVATQLADRLAQIADMYWNEIEQKSGIEIRTQTKIVIPMTCKYKGKVINELKTLYPLIKKIFEKDKEILVLVMSMLNNNQQSTLLSLMGFNMYLKEYHQLAKKMFNILGINNIKF